MSDHPSVVDVLAFELHPWDQFILATCVLALLDRETLL